MATKKQLKSTKLLELCSVVYFSINCICISKKFFFLWKNIPIYMYIYSRILELWLYFLVRNACVKRLITFLVWIGDEGCQLFGLFYDTLSIKQCYLPCFPLALAGFVCKYINYKQHWIWRSMFICLLEILLLHYLFI